MRVFISYAGRDKAAFQRLLSAFQAARFHVWWDEELGGGELWWRGILEQIRGCDVFVFALSQNSLDSKHCLTEYRYAKAVNKRVLPVQIGGAKSNSMRESPFAATNVIDYRVPSENTAIRLIEDARQTRRKPLPDPLPPEPPRPYEFFVEMKEEISGGQLIPTDQLQVLFKLKERLKEAGDSAARADIADLLYDLRNRPDTTPEIRAECDAELKSLNFKPPGDRRLTRKWMFSRKWMDDLVAPARIRIGERNAGARLSSSVFAPPAVGSGDNFVVYVFAHVPEDDALVESLARKYDPGAAPMGSVGLRSVVREGELLAFELLLPGLLVDDPVQSMVWMGRPQSVQFGVTVPPDLAPRNVVGTVMISRDSVPVGHLKFKLTVRESGAIQGRVAELAATHGMHRYRRAFISYASADRNEVLKRTQMLDGVGIEFFQDILTLEPGEHWERRVYDEIDLCDLFLLFWSSAAKTSQWVLKEVDYALMLNGGNELVPPEILPVIIEGPPPVPPPPELAHLHFNDRILYFMHPKRTNWFAKLRRRGS